MSCIGYPGGAAWLLAVSMVTVSCAHDSGARNPPPMREDAYPGELVDSAALPADLFMRQRIEASVGTLFSLENPEQLAARIQRESAAWAKLIKAAKVDLQ